MGGCRCSFRECTVSTSRYPNMHFFHFPLKDQQRLQKWLKMAAAEQILEKPMVFQKNRVVCARHFRDECFMNYKKDRLIQTAVPTLMRLSKNLAVDYELENPTVIRLEEPSMSHLICPPKFQDPLDFEHEEFNDVELLCETNQPELELDTSKNTANYKKRQKSENEIEITNSKKPKILNKEVKNHNYKMKMQPKIQENSIYEESVIIMTNVGANDEQTEFIVITDENSKETSEVNIIRKDISCQTDLLMDENATNDHSAETQEIAESRERIIDLEKELEHSQREHRNLLDKFKKMVSSKDALKKELLVAREELQQLKQINTKLQQTQLAASVDNNKNINCHAVAPFRPSQTVANASTISDDYSYGKLSVLSSTRSQLFNGITKYLSASMVALVRMEMFGNVERDWKPDEQRTAVDLLRLGENIYRYFTEEWRLRLPAISEVQQWMNINPKSYEEEH